MSADSIIARLIEAWARAHHNVSTKAPAHAQRLSDEWIVTVRDGRDWTYVVQGLDLAAATVPEFLELEETDDDLCAECGAEPGRGAWWDEDDRGEPFADGCATCAALLVRRAEDARTDAGVDALEDREVA